jgi:NAD-dependent dihydropyrimidine dehydrogenase PreA subunit
MRHLAARTLRLDTAACIGCGACAEVCPHAVFQIENPKARIVAEDRCMECGACARNCPVKAITVRTGVGCATGLINRALGRQGDCCCESTGCG